jgi:hypothetical protein
MQIYCSVGYLTDPPKLHLSLHASIVIVYGPQRLHFELLKVLNFEFNAAPHPAFHSDADRDLASHKNADPDSQPWHGPQHFCRQIILPVFNCFFLCRELLNHSYVKGESAPEKELLGTSRINIFIINIAYDPARASHLRV